jgi:hypothetical protein
MATEVEIANRALTKIGANRITALAENTKEGRTVNSLYEIVLDAELRAHTWKFSIKRASVAVSPGTPVYGFSKQYALPADCLRVLSIGEFDPPVDMSDYVGSDTAPYVIEGGYILTDYASPIKMRYIARQSDPTLFDAGFIEAFACRLAMELAEPLSASDTKLARAAQQYKDAVTTALMANAIEAPPKKISDDAWVLARL